VAQFEFGIAVAEPTDAVGGSETVDMTLIKLYLSKVCLNPRPVEDDGNQSC
jgi:hypothetical protein